MPAAAGAARAGTRGKADAAAVPEEVARGGAAHPAGPPAARGGAVPSHEFSSWAVLSAKLRGSRAMMHGGGASGGR